MVLYFGRLIVHFLPSNIFYFTVSSQHHKMQENREGKSNSTAGDFEEKLFELVADVENENKQDSTVAMKKLWALIGRNPSTDRIESVLATNVVKRVIECLKMCDGDRSTTSAKILEVITVCSNLNQIEYVVEAGALPVFVNILWRPISNDSIDHKPIIVAVGKLLKFDS